MILRRVSAKPTTVVHHEVAIRGRRLILGILYNAWMLETADVLYTHGHYVAVGSLSAGRVLGVPWWRRGLSPGVAAACTEDPF